MKESKQQKFWFYLINGGLVALFLAPFYWTLNTSFKSRAEVFQYPPTFWPSDFSLESYQRLVEAGDGIFLSYAWNSLIVASSSVLFAVICSTLGGYAFSKLKFPGMSIIFMLLLAVIMVPYQALLVPLYSLLNTFGMLDTRIGLVLVYTTFWLPVAMFIMRNSFEGISNTLRESALLDGAGEFTVLTRIFLPLIWPGLLSVVVIVFMRVWNDFIIALIFTSTRDSMTVQVGLRLFAEQRFYADFGLMSAGNVLSMLPVIFLFIMLQKYFVRGVMRGALK